MGEGPGERLKDDKVGGAFKVQHPSGLLGLVVLVESDLAKCLHGLASAVVDAMRLADEGDDDVALGGLLQQHLGMRGDDDLVAGLSCRLRQHIVDLALPEDFEMGSGSSEHDGAGFVSM